MLLTRLGPASFILVLAAASPDVALAQCPPNCDLDDLRTLALRNAPEVDRSEADIDFSRAQLDQARYAALDLGSAALTAAPTALHRGDMIHSFGEDVSLSDEMGLWVTLNIDLAIALTPWWTLAEYWRAARHAVDMSEREAERLRAATVLAVDLASREVQLNEAVLTALRRARRAVQQAHNHIDHLLEEDLPGAVEADRLRLVIVLSEFDARRVQVQSARRRATARLRRLVGLRREVALDLPSLPDAAPPQSPLEWHLETARHLRPEVRLTVAALSAARSLLRARQSEFVPLLAIGGYYNFRSTPVVDDQHNPYARDPWNGYGFGYGLAYRWTPSVGERMGRLGRARADIARARAMRRFALGGITYEVELAWVAVQENRDQLETRRLALSASSRRFEALLVEQRRGQVPASELADGARDWVNSEIGVLRSRARFLQSISRLDVASGRATSETEQ